MIRKVKKHPLAAFMLAIILLITGAVFASRFSALNLGGTVALADENEDEDKDEDRDDDGEPSDGEENKDDAEEDEKNEAAKKAEEEAEEAAEKQKEIEKKKEEEAKKAQKKLSENNNDKDDEDEDEDEKGDDNDGDDEDGDGDEDENENEADDDSAITKNIVTNKNGTTTEIITKTEDDEIKTIIITRDQNGNIIERKVTETDENKTETKTTAYDIYGKKLSEIEIKTIDGKVIKIEAREGSQKVKYETDEDELVIDADNDDDEEFGEESDEVRIKSEGESFRLKSKKSEIKINFPMEIDGETGKIYVVTPNGKVELKSMPDVIAQKAQSAGLDSVSKLELKMKNNQLQYEIEGIKEEKFLGVFRIKIKSTQQYNPESGELLFETQSFWGNILESLSFGK